MQYEFETTVKNFIDIKTKTQDNQHKFINLKYLRCILTERVIIVDISYNSKYGINKTKYRPLLNNRTYKIIINVKILIINTCEKYELHINSL